MIILSLTCCSSTELETLKEPASSNISTWSCTQNIDCVSGVSANQNESESQLYQCKIPMVNGGLAAWGPSKCEAEKALKNEICKNKIKMTSILRISCIPDPSGGECPKPQRFCTFEYKPSTCRAKTYNGSSLNWNLQPIARSSNACLARLKLEQRACYSGLLPSLLDDIVCEEDKTGGLCPPKYNCKKNDSKKKTTCTATKFGDQELSPPWKESALNECEAKFAIYQRACSYADASNELKPDQLGDISCH